MRVLVLALLAGCSIVTVHGPSSEPGKYLQCTTSRTVPIIDLVTGGLLVGGGAAVAYWDRHDSTPSTGTKTYAISIPAIVIGVAFLAASQYGASRVARCREAHAADSRWHPAPP